MSTRAIIRFKDRHEEYFVYRHHDGNPTNVLSDINYALEVVKGRWNGSECGLLVSAFLGMNYDYRTQRVPDYMLVKAASGDESFRYEVVWDAELERWTSDVVDTWSV